MEQNNKSYEPNELIIGVLSVITMLVIFWISIVTVENNNQYIGHKYLKSDISGYETPYDILTINRDNTVTLYYRNTIAIIPYQDIDNHSFSFILPTDNQKYIVKLQPKPNTISKQNKVLVNLPIALITNDIGFKQALIDKKSPFEINSDNYSAILNNEPILSNMKEKQDVND